jgi:uncharacterized membrane protein YfcA
MVDEPKAKPASALARSNLSLLLSLGFELGYMIAIPAVVGAFGGAYLDKSLGTSPLFILLGIFLAITSSVAWIGRFIKRLNQAEGGREDA